MIYVLFNSDYFSPKLSWPDINLQVCFFFFFKSSRIEFSFAQITWTHREGFCLSIWCCWNLESDFSIRGSGWSLEALVPAEGIMDAQGMTALGGGVGQPWPADMGVIS